MGSSTSKDSEHQNSATESTEINEIKTEASKPDDAATDNEEHQSGLASSNNVQKDNEGVEDAAVNGPEAQVTSEKGYARETVTHEEETVNSVPPSTTETGAKGDSETRDSTLNDQQKVQSIPSIPASIQSSPLVKPNHDTEDATDKSLELNKMPRKPMTLISNNDEGLRCLSQNEIEDLILKQHGNQVATRHQSVSMKSVDSRRNIYNSELIIPTKVLDRDPEEWNIQVKKNIDGFDMDKFKAANKKQLNNSDHRRSTDNTSLPNGDSSLINIHKYSMDDERLMASIESEA